MIDYEKKFKDIKRQVSHKHLKRLGNCHSKLAFSMEKARFEREYMFLDEKIERIKNTKDEEFKLQLYTELLVYLENVIFR